jgi:thioredoxin 1
MKTIPSLLQVHFAVFTALCLIPACNNRNPAGVQNGEGENVFVFSSGNFSAEVLSSPQPVLVDFWASWCGPCRMIAPIVSELAGEFKGRVKVGKVNVDAEPDLARQYGITAIPALLIFKDGKQVDQIVGLGSKEELQAKLSKWVEDSATNTQPPKP